MGLGYWKSSTGVCFYSGSWILEEAKTGAVAGFSWREIRWWVSNIGRG